MNQQQARTALAAGNLVLTILVLVLGYVTLCPTQFVPERILRWREPPEDSRVPNFNPLRLKLDDKPPSTNPFQDYEVVWKQVDKPPPPPPPPEPAKPPGPSIEDLATKFKLSLVALDRAKPGSSYAILDPKAGGEQLVVAVNEQLAQPYQMYKCLNIEGTETECTVTLEDAAHHPSKIKLKVEKAPE
jgi:hypothetical protein